MKLFLLIHKLISLFGYKMQSYKKMKIVITKTQVVINNILIIKSKKKQLNIQKRFYLLF